MKGLSFFHKIIYFFNVPFGFILLFSYLANFINPSVLPWVGLVGLGYPIWLSINLLFMLIWILGLKKQFIFSLFCIAVGYNQLFTLFQTNGLNMAFADNENVMHVMTYNVRTFNLHLFENWQESAREIRKVIKNEDADIVCLQEYYEGSNSPKFNYRYKHIHFTNKHFGLAIFSKFKIINKGTIEYGVDKGVYKVFIYADIINAKKDTVRIVNAHLLSIRLDSKNLKDLSNSVLSQQELEKQKQKLIKPLLNGFRGRGDQAKKLGGFIEESPYPIILCADFNDTPGSYTYRQASKQLKDSFVACGQGMGTTLPSFKHRYLPLRIDFIFSSDYFNAYNHEVVNKEFSDHYPVVVDLKY